MQPKKSLGQNFLKDEIVLNKIIKAADLKSDDFVLEIGPGTGILTEKLVKKAKLVLAVEKDDVLAKKLKNSFKQANNLEIIHGDIMGINLPEVLENHKVSNKKYKLVANIPYYITSPIIQLLLETTYRPSEMILMVQKEVAERICGKPGNMSILAVSVQYYAKPELLFYVDRKSFFPVPEVDSAVIRITIENESPRKDDIKRFFRVVRAGFSSKRKTLINNLSASFHLDKKYVEEKIKKHGFQLEIRAQELSVDNWKVLAKEFS